MYGHSLRIASLFSYICVWQLAGAFFQTLPSGLQAFSEREKRWEWQCASVWVSGKVRHTYILMSKEGTAFGCKLEKSGVFDTKYFNIVL